MQTASILQGSPILGFFLMLGAIIGLQYGIAHFRNSVIGIGLLLLMTGLLGWFIGPLLNHALSVQNGASLVGYAAAGTGAVFFGMATIATVTKRDFSFMGKFLFAGMIALMVAMVANMFMQIPMLSLVISSLVIVVFSLYLLFDLSRIVTGGETNYVMATTGVYISMLNIFTSLLSILTGGRD
jgi:modulator of FtsH protease